MKEYLLNLLECPCCHEELSWNISQVYGNEIVEAHATCKACLSQYPVHEGIALFTKQRIAENDPWEKADSQMAMMFKQYPQIEQELIYSNNENSSPTDLFLKALLLEEKGNIQEAKSIYKLAHNGLYTQETLHSMSRQFDYVCRRINNDNEPVLDLASGRCLFAENLVLSKKNPVIITDFSPRVLRRNREYFKLINKYDNISLIAMDACSTPFKSMSVKIATTFMGLPNIENSEGFLKEIKRIVSGNFFAIHAFYPDDESDNAKVIRKANLDKFSFKESAIQNFSFFGLNIDIENSILTHEKASEPGRIVQGARINAIPASEVISEWCTLVIE